MIGFNSTKPTFFVGPNNSSNPEGLGKIGIGTSSPLDKLHVVGGIRSSGSAADYNDGDQLTMDYNTGNSRINSRNSAGTANLGIYTNNAERIKITSNGDVGIGTANPTEKFEVIGNLKATNIEAANIQSTGGIQVGSSSNNVEGTIRWTGQDLEVFNGTGWASLTKGGGAPVCTDWTYSDWSICDANGVQTRSIISSSDKGCSIITKS